jgi:hypothetical protein
VHATSERRLRSGATKRALERAVAEEGKVCRSKSWVANRNEQFF